MYLVHFIEQMTPALWRFSFIFFFAGICLSIAVWYFACLEVKYILARSRIARWLFWIFLITTVTTLNLNAINSVFHSTILASIDDKIRSGAALAHPETLTGNLMIHGFAWVVGTLVFIAFLRRGTREATYARESSAVSD